MGQFKDRIHYYGGALDEGILCLLNNDQKHTVVCCDRCPVTCFEHKEPCFDSQKPKKIIFECGCNPQDANITPIVPVNSTGLIYDPAYILDRVLVDTSDLKKPLVKLDFCSLIYFEVEGNVGTGVVGVELELLFKLVRTCNGVSECIQTWRYVFDEDLEDTLTGYYIRRSVPFCVSYCDRTCPGCCEYKMVVEGRTFEGTFTALRVTNPSLSAIAQGQCD